MYIALVQIFFLFERNLPFQIRFTGVIMSNFWEKKHKITFDALDVQIPINNDDDPTIHNYSTVKKGQESFYKLLL